MREGSWEECIECNSAIKITPDLLKVRSLIKIADGRINYLQSQKINTENANYIFEGFYTSINEFIHAIAAFEGYKIINHICLSFFIRDFLENMDLFRLFDDLRYKRNSLVYYGKEMDFEVAKDSIEKAKKLIKGLEKIVKVKIKSI